MSHLQLILIRFLVTVWGICGILSLVALIIIVARPRVWTSWIDKENDYWVKHGRFSRQTAEKMKKLESGPPAKLLLGAIFLFSIFILCLLLRAPPNRPFRAMPPPVPLLRRQPGH